MVMVMMYHDLDSMPKPAIASWGITALKSHHNNCVAKIFRCYYRGGGANTGGIIKHFRPGSFVLCVFLSAAEKGEWTLAKVHGLPRRELLDILVKGGFLKALNAEYIPSELLL